MIWFCREWECNYNGWVLGKGDNIITSADNMFSADNYDETGNFRIYIKYDHGADNSRMPRCACDITEVATKERFEKLDS